MRGQRRSPCWGRSEVVESATQLRILGPVTDARYLRLALRLARRGSGATSPNPMVGAVLVKGGKVIGRGSHHRAGLPHAEIEALEDARKRHHTAQGATLYVTLEPCSTHGRTPPCTEAIACAGIRRVVVGAIDPNPRHAGRGLSQLRRAGLTVVTPGQSGRRARSDAPYLAWAAECERLNEAFNHWIVHRTPFVTVKAAMTLDGKIATATGESKWITAAPARRQAMRLRASADAILAGVNTILADDPALTDRSRRAEIGGRESEGGSRKVRRFILDSMARTPLKSRVVTDAFALWTTIVVSRHAPKRRVAALAKRVRVLVAPVRTQNSKLKTQNLQINLSWLLRRLGSEEVTNLLVEGGGEVNASFVMGGHAQRVVFFYAPRVLSGREARKGVAGVGAARLDQLVQLGHVEWKKRGVDLMLTARVIHAR